MTTGVITELSDSDKDPGFYGKTAYGAGPISLLSIPLKLLLIGLKHTSLGSLTNDTQIVRVYSETDVDTYAGAGGELARMAYGAFKIPNVEIYLAAPAPDPSPTSATMTIVIGGTWSTAGTLRVIVAGLDIDCAVTASQSTANVATALGAAINAKSKCAASAGVVGSTVTLTWKTPTVRGNRGIVFRDLTGAPSGLTATLGGGGSTVIGDATIGIIIASYFFHYTGMQHVYFESALIIIGLMNLGAFLEDRAKSNTSSAIKSLMALQPNETTIIKDNKEQLIKTNLLANGDIIKIKPGERLPADGVIIDGNGYLDESMITGEPIAIYKKANDKVIAGSINTNGSFTFQASGVGNNTFLAEIIKLVKDAQISKPELAKLADKVAGIFVPTIILIAIFSALIWYFIGPEPKMFYSVSIFMTVLIIACPCSVGLAVPVALMVGLGKSATKGILIRDTSCLSKIDKLDYILLDKTGTITKGKPEVVNFQVSDGYSKSECLSIIKSLENNSEHPLAAAMLTFASNNDTTMLETTEFEMIAGSGLSAVINDIKYYIVSKHYVQNSLHLDSELIVRNHFTQAFLATDNDVLARIDISDTIKDDSINAIKKLQSIGLKVAMVTGDNQENAEYIAEQIGLDKVYANCKPQDKIEIVKSMQENYNVAFVGDGINDAPSLVQADVGIAIGSGTDIAMQSAQITLINSSLDGISKAITIGKSINKNMKQNLFGSFVYNTLAVAIAAGALYPFGHVLLNPIIASTAMSLSSITVILNALRLKYL
jgi:Cu+-exporting ATPase